MGGVESLVASDGDGCGAGMREVSLRLRQDQRRRRRSASVGSGLAVFLAAFLAAGCRPSARPGPAARGSTRELPLVVTLEPTQDPELRVRADSRELPDVVARRGDRVLWRDATSAGLANLVPQSRTVIYWRYYSMGVVGREADGRLFGGSGPIAVETGPDVLCASTTTAIVTSGPAPDEIWLKFPQAWRGHPVATAVDARTGRCLWTDTCRLIGAPMWTAGPIFVDVRLMRTYWWNPPPDVRHSPYAWLEVRRLQDRKRIWKKPLTGYPHGITRVEPAGKHAARFYFDDARDGRPYLGKSLGVRHMKPFSVVIPIDPNLIPRGGVTPPHPHVTVAPPSP